MWRRGEVLDGDPNRSFWRAIHAQLVGSQRGGHPNLMNDGLTVALAAELKSIPSDAR
jgi:hypothetical protein